MEFAFQYPIDRKRGNELAAKAAKGGREQSIPAARAVVIA
jgi:hypothetical protein